MLLNNSKYFIRKNALVINRAPSTLFPINAYYNLEHIIKDIVGNNQGGGNYLPLVLTSNTAVDGGTYDLNLGGQGDVDMYKSDLGTRAGLFLHNQFGAVQSSLYWRNLTNADIIRAVVVKHNGVNITVSDNMATTNTISDFTSLGFSLYYNDKTDALRRAGIDTSNNGTEIFGRQVEIKANTDDPNYSSILTTHTRALLQASNDTAVSVSLIQATQTTSELAYHDRVTPANTASVVAASGEIKLDATRIKLVGIPEYADDAAAGVAGLQAGDLFRTGGQLFIKL